MTDPIDNSNHILDPINNNRIAGIQTPGVEIEPIGVKEAGKKLPSKEMVDSEKNASAKGTLALAISKKIGIGLLKGLVAVLAIPGAILVGSLVTILGPFIMIASRNGLDYTDGMWLGYLGLVDKLLDKIDPPNDKEASMKVEVAGDQAPQAHIKKTEKDKEKLGPELELSEVASEKIETEIPVEKAGEKEGRLDGVKNRIKKVKADHKELREHVEKGQKDLRERFLKKI